VNRGQAYQVFPIAGGGSRARNEDMSKTMLVADNSATMRLAVRLLLESRKPELVVQEAVDGLDAIEKAKTLKPDLIVLDLAMPRMNGADAAMALKKSMPTTPIVLFTLYSDVGRVLSSAIGVEVISKTDGIPKLIERVLSQRPAARANEPDPPARERGIFPGTGPPRPTDAPRHLN